MMDTIPSTKPRDWMMVLRQHVQQFNISLKIRLSNEIQEENAD